MTTVDTATDAGTSAPTDQEPNTAPTETLPTDDGGKGGDDAGDGSPHDEGASKGKGVSKLLNQRNQARKEADELRAKYEPDTLQAVNDVMSVEKRKVERQSFQATYGDEALDEVEAILEQHPSLSYEDAFKVANPEQFASLGESYNVTGSTPSKLTAGDKDLASLTPAELEAQAQKDFASMM